MDSKKTNKITYIILLVIVVISTVVYMVNGGSFKKSKTGFDETGKGLEAAEVAVHFIDVGQGDAAFIDTPGKDILIDAGPGTSAPQLLDYLDDLDVYDIEYAFFSHPHEDHIGGGDDILTHFSVTNAVMPERTEDTACYRQLMRTAEEECNVIYASAGDKFVVDDITVEIYSPEAGAKADDANFFSFIMKVSYGETDFMFTGDAETENELYAIENYGDVLDCEVLKLGHHGSSTSTCEDFLYAVSPEIAVISVGEGNSYGHPHRETLALLNGYMDKIYRTDYDGSIVVGCDKEQFWIVE